MATLRWLGHAPAVAQVSTVQITAYDVATTYKLTVNGKVISVIAQGSVNATASGLVTAWNALSASTYPEFDEVTATSATDTVTLTADLAGRPFTVTSSVSGGAGTIGAVATPTASAGPNDWSTATNWSGGVIPGADTVYIEDSAVSILYGLDQSGVTVTALHVPANFTGQIGLPERNQRGYTEYRDTHLKVSVTTLNIGIGPGAGSGRIKINTGTNVCTCNVERTGQTLEPGVPSFCWKGVHASNALNVQRGYVGVAFFGLDAATLPTLRVGHTGNPGGDSQVFCGSGSTLTTINQLAGVLEVNSAVTTLTIRGGVCTVRGSGAVTTLELGVTEPRNPTTALCNYNSTGTTTTANVRMGGTLDFSQNMGVKTFTATNMFVGGRVRDPFRVVTFTAGPTLSGGATPSEVFIEIG